MSLSGLPRFSVSFVLATFNRGPTVINCLRRTLACAADVLTQFSIVVVDNASTDGTAELIAALAREEPRVRLIRLSKNCGPVAKNLGLHNNPADVLILLDDDAYPLPGSLPQMLRHFRDDPHLGAAVFDVTLPDGTKEASAYPDVFIGAGTALRTAALRGLQARARSGGGGTEAFLPPDFFMQAEEYDLSFRLLEAGWSIQRFWDMPLLHLKTPGARIGQRTTRLDVRNNLYLLAKYVPQPLCDELAADWLARYWLMAAQRDQQQPASPHGSHKANYIKGAAQGLAAWSRQRQGGRHLLSPRTIERIFKFDAIAERLSRAQHKAGLRRIAFADLGKNLLAFHRAAQRCGLEVCAILDDNLTREGSDYRGIPLCTHAQFLQNDPVDAIVLTALSPVHAARRAAALRRVLTIPVIDLFSRQDGLLQGPRSAPSMATIAG